MPSSLFTRLSLGLAIGGAAAWPPNHGPPSWGPPWGGPPSAHSWHLRNFKTLVTFGDSYTDLNRLDYLINHGGQAPPVGWVDPGVSLPCFGCVFVHYLTRLCKTSPASDGGRPWPSYVGQYSGAKVYNYAVAGAVCSNNITPRYFSYINGLFPAVQQNEVPAYIADSKYVMPNGKKFMDDSPDSTVYAIFIGTNDLGNGAFLTGNQVNGTTIPDYIDCVYDSLSQVYANGGRYFVIFNIAPLDLTPQYGLPGQGGLAKSQYYPDKPADIAAVHYHMLNEVSTVNAVYEYRTPYEVELARKYPGASFALYDVNGLVST